jgi:hypothetical protein
MKTIGVHKVETDFINNVTIYKLLNIIIIIIIITQLIYLRYVLDNSQTRPLTDKH